MIQQVELLTSPEEAQRIYECIKRHPLDYPGYLDWLEKCRRELEIGEKWAFYVISKGEIVGSIVFQRHRKEPSIIELKNLRVSEEYRRRGIASLLERRVCQFGRSNDFKRIQADAHYYNFPAIQFLIKMGYMIIAEEEIYAPNKLEVILAKDL